MFIEKWHVYHIKDEYFKFAKVDKLMKNYENGLMRPTYLCVKKKNSKILWFIPMSSKIEKYRKLREDKIKKQSV